MTCPNCGADCRREPPLLRQVRDGADRRPPAAARCPRRARPACPPPAARRAAPRADRTAGARPPTAAPHSARTAPSDRGRRPAAADPVSAPPGPPRHPAATARRPATRRRDTPAGPPGTRQARVPATGTRPLRNQRAGRREPRARPRRLGCSCGPRFGARDRARLRRAATRSSSRGTADAARAWPPPASSSASSGRVLLVLVFLGRASCAAPATASSESRATQDPRAARADTPRTDADRATDDADPPT